MKKLSQKERGEVVTKGFLEDQDFVTKNYLEQSIESALRRYQKEDRAHLEALMEDYHQRIYSLVELFDARFERIERKIGLA